MTMNSLSLIPQLLELPTEPGLDLRSNREHLEALVNTDRATYAAEHASATAVGFWTFFDTVNVDDTIMKAYQVQYPNLAEDHSIYEQWAEMMDRGEESMTGFIRGIKGKVAEFSVADQLREAGWTSVEVAPNPTQPVFDVTATPPEGGATILWQVKTGGAGYAHDIADAMAEAPDVHFAVSSEIYDRVADSTPEAVDRLMDMGADWELVEGIQDGLGTLAGDLGIDVPDSLVKILPYSGAVVAGARLIYGVIRTEREFRDADRTSEEQDSSRTGPLPDVPDGNNRRPIGRGSVGRSSSRDCCTRAGQPSWRSGRRLGRECNGLVSEPASPAADAAAGAEHLRTGGRRPLLLQEQVENGRVGAVFPRNSRPTGEVLNR